MNSPDFLGVPPGKLSSWINLKNKAITPAVKEVSDLSEFLVTIEPIKGKARSFSQVRLSWERKATAELHAVVRELSFSKVGRKARLSGSVEDVNFGVASPPRPLSRQALSSDTFGKVKVLCPGYDPYYLEQEWRSWAAKKPPADNPDAAFIAFCKTYAKHHPLKC